MTSAKKRVKPVEISVAELRHSTILVGPSKVLVPVLRRLDCPRVYDVARGGFAVPKGRADDVLAMLEEDGYRVDIPMAW